MTVFETLDSEHLGNDDRMLRSKLFVVRKCPEGDTISCQMPGPRGLIMHQMHGVCPGKLLAAGIDSHISCSFAILRTFCVLCMVKANEQKK